MKRNAEKTGIYDYDEDNAKALIGRLFREITGRSSKELTIVYDDFSYKVILNKKESFVTRGLFETYYKCYSDRAQREYVIAQIKNKIRSLIDSE